MNKQYFSPEQDDFYGVYYPNAATSRKAVIVMLGDYHGITGIIGDILGLYRSLFVRLFLWQD